MRKFFVITSILLAVFSANMVWAQTETNISPPCEPGESTSTGLCNPFARLGGFDGAATPIATNIVQLIIKIIFIMAGFATLLPIIAITYSGFSMVISQGNPESISRAKAGLTWAVGGFVLAILSYVIIAAMINLMGANMIPDPLAPPEEKVQNPLSTDEFTVFIFGLLGRFLEIVGVVALLSIIISGFRYITSAGNEEAASQAKTALQWSVIGLVTILLSYVIIKATAAIFNIS